MDVSVIEGHSGKARNSRDARMADDVIEKKNNKGPWKTIETLIRIWMEKSPEDFRAFKKHIRYTREDLKDKEFGTTVNQDQDRRLTMVLPVDLHNMIRSVYKPDELDMDDEFFKEFAKRFPMFQVPEKL